MPRNLIVFLDGTWNNSVSTDTPPTNVYALFQSAAQENSVKSYYPGVGAHTGSIGNLLYGATGKGAFQAARLAWQQIAANYLPGDVISIFGFSRGAFAARSLASMVVRFGVHGWQGNIEQTFRQWQAAVDTPCLEPRQEVHLLGLFDCVPGNQLYLLRDRAHHLNSPRLEPGILHFRHAVALDERRWSFQPLLFEPQPYHESFEQRWFPGYHSDVGGGNEIAGGIAAFSRWWMLREAYGLGIDFQNIECPRHIARHRLSVLRAVDPDDAPVLSDYWTTRLGLRCHRKGLPGAVNVSETPVFSELDQCPRCKREMFDYFLTDCGQRWLIAKGLAKPAETGFAPNPTFSSNSRPSPNGRDEA